MFQRVLGLLLIVRALSPFLVIAIIAVLGGVIIRDLHAVIEEPVHNIDAEFREMQETIETAREDVATLTRQVASVVNTLRSFRLPDLIPVLPASLTIPAVDLGNVTVPIPDISVGWSNSPNVRYPSGIGFSWTSGLSVTWSNFSIRYPSSISVSTNNYSLSLPDIPQLDLPLPGLREFGNLLRGALSGIGGIFNVFDEAFESIGSLGASLQSLSESFNVVVGETKTAMESLRDTILRWGSVLVVAGVILLLLAVVYFIVPTIDGLRRGWRMLRGLPT